MIKELRMGQLEGRVAVVTGAARGQGRAHALALAGEGASVVVCDIASQVDSVSYPLATKDELGQTVGLVEEAGGECLGVVTDIRNTEQVAELVDLTLTAFGRLDILVANAGIMSAAPADQIDDVMWDDVVDTNLTGTFKCVRAVLPVMRRQGYGRIVVTSSMSGRHGNRNLAHYCASKFGLIGMAKAVALAVAGTGITVNVMCPTAVTTPMLVNDMTFALFCPDIEHPTLEDAKPRFAGQNPLGVPWMEPDTFTRAIIYLVTDPGFVTGSVLEVSAGASAALP